MPRTIEKRGETQQLDVNCDFVEDTYDKKILLTPKQQQRANRDLYEALGDDTIDRVKKAIEEEGAQVNNTTADGWKRTPLTITIMLNNTEVAEYLKSKGGKAYPDIGGKAYPDMGRKA